MRLGAFDVDLKEGTLIHGLYGSLRIRERHRHRYEVNAEYQKAMEEKGLLVSGTYSDRRLVETVELPGHPFFVASQFHPEFRSRPLQPHPLFLGFVRASLDFARETGGKA